MQKILLIGGGTGGHILPLLPLIESLKKNNFCIDLVVSDQELDKKIIKENFKNLEIKINFFSTGKIRRYISWKNFIDIFKIISAIFRAKKLIKKINPDSVFFKGGFVGFPFFVAIKIFYPKLRKKIFLHESDISPGALTKILAKNDAKIFTNFEVVQDLKNYEYQPLFFETKKISPKPSKIKKILILGGSQGALFLNNLFVQNKEILCKKYFVTLITGLNNKINVNKKNFQQFEILSAKNLSAKINSADLIISRAGANTLLEIISAKKSSLIVPLPSSARNHQYFNAKYFFDRGLCKLLEQKNYDPKKLEKIIEDIFENKVLQQNLEKSDLKNSAQEIVKKIL